MGQPGEADGCLRVPVAAIISFDGADRHASVIASRRVGRIAQLWLSIHILVFGGGRLIVELASWIVFHQTSMRNRRFLRLMLLRRNRYGDAARVQGCAGGKGQP